MMYMLLLCRQELKMNMSTEIKIEIRRGGGNLSSQKFCVVELFSEFLSHETDPWIQLQSEAQHITSYHMKPFLIPTFRNVFDLLCRQLS